MNKCAIFALFAMCVALMCSANSSAQRASGSFAHFSRAIPPHPMAGANGSLASRQDLSALRRFRGGPYGEWLSSLGVLSDFVGDPSTYGAAASAPNFFLMPSLTSPTVSEDEPRPSAAPLMIELRGDRYVRVTNSSETPDASSANYQQPPIASSASGQKPLAIRVVPAAAPSTANTSLRAASELQPAVLIYRDGHSESVRDYAIANGMLYARGDYYTDGYWTKTIDLAGLNLPATISSNSNRGVKFVLPSAPNEVVTRP